jgi:hypothetical protein
MKKYFLLFLIISQLASFSNPIDKSIITDWSNPGCNFIIPANAKKVSILDFGGKADNSTDNSSALQNAIKSINGVYGIIEIPNGNYLFKKSISIPSNILIKGNGSDKTVLNFNLGGIGDLFSIQGNLSTNSTPISSEVKKDIRTITVANATNYIVGDYCIVRQSADYLLFNNWSYNSFFQIVKITQINGNTISFEKPLRLDFPAKNKPVLVKLNPVLNSGIEALKIKRFDQTTSNQTSNIFFNYAANCWIKGVEFENTNYAHITLQSSANTTISGNYIHDAFDYGSGGKGYGVVLQFGASDNFIFDNIAQHLRHSFLLQAQANGNVIAYNYSFEPFWKETWFPANAAGDIVLHGNYPYTNLFEGNIIQNLVIDNSHGANGPFNTFFRNRIESYGVVMNNQAGEHMNSFANEITGNGILKGLYGLSGDNIEIANNIKGNIREGNITETSLISSKYNSKIGPPNLISSCNNDAFVRAAKSVKTFCSPTYIEIKKEVAKPDSVIQPKTTTSKPVVKPKTTTTKKTTKKPVTKKAPVKKK